VRPTVSEQLAGVRRILSDVIAPEVSGAYPIDMLRGVLANLEMLEQSWTRVGPFLAWDNEGTEQVLRSVVPFVDGDLAARITALVVAAPVDASDVGALEARNTALRAVLADAVPALARGGDAAAPAFAGVRRHLRDRIERFPLTMNAPMPGAAR
jgi:hypothetical protein